MEKDPFIDDISVEMMIWDVLNGRYVLKQPSYLFDIYIYIDIAM